MGCVCGTAEERLYAEGADPDALAAAGRGGVRAADRMRERGEPPAGARHDAAERDGRTKRARRGAKHDLRAIADGGCVAGDGWWCAGCWGWVRDAAGADRGDAAGHTAI